MKPENLMYTLHELKHLFEGSGVDFMLIKFPKLPKQHRDLDILLFNHIGLAVDAMKREGYVFEKSDEPYRLSCTKTVNGGKVPIDIHLEVAWWGVAYLLKEDLLEHKALRVMGGVEIPTPSPEYEVLITAANALFGEIKITPFDIRHIASLTTDGVDEYLIRSQAKKNNWLKQYLYFIHHLRELKFNLKPESHFPVHTIITLRFGKVLSDLRHCGMKRAVCDLRGYCLEITQIAIDYLRWRGRIPSNPLFNMRKFLGDGNDE